MPQTLGMNSFFKRMPKNSQVSYKTLYSEMAPLGLYLAQDIIPSPFTATLCLFSLESGSISYPRKLWKCLKGVVKSHLLHCFYILEDNKCLSQLGGSRY